MVEEFIKIASKNDITFIKQLYLDSYADPDTQTAILEGLLDANKSETQAIALQLMERDLPLGYVSSIFYNSTTKDSLELKAKLFPKILEFSTIKEYKQPLYKLLSKLKDSSKIQPNAYSNYKKQLINDGKIEVKRSLSKTNSYSSYSKALSTYVSLLFPYRNEVAAQDFYEKLLNVEDYNALTKYYVLLAKHKAKIPKKLKEKTLEDEEQRYLTLEALHDAKLLDQLKATEVTQQQFAKSKLLDNARYEKEKDSVRFLLTKPFVTDKGKKATMYFYKIEKDSEYRGKLEVLHYIAFLEPKTPKQLVIDYYYMSKSAGTEIDKTKTLEEQYQDILTLAKYKDRRRVTASSNRNYNNYYGY